MSSKVFVQLDVQNLFFSAKDKNKRIDFLKIKDHFQKTGDEIVGLNAYIVRTPDAPYHKFEAFLKSIGYTLNIKTASIGYAPGGQRIYKGTDQDLAICIDAMKNMDKFDKWVLMSGDGDFIDLCKHLKDNNKFIEIWAIAGGSFNKKFCDYADAITFMSDNFFYDENQNRTQNEKPGNNLQALSTT